MKRAGIAFSRPKWSVPWADVLIIQNNRAMISQVERQGLGRRHSHGKSVAKRVGAQFIHSQCWGSHWGYRASYA
jgi:hypothetical protein